MSSREVIQPHQGDKRYARRNAEGQFTENQVDVGKSLAADRRSKAKKIVPKGQGDRGDQKNRSGHRGSESRRVAQLRLKSCGNLFQGRQFRTEVFSSPARRA